MNAIRSVVIYLFKQQGCQHCRTALAEVVKFRAARPEALVVELDESAGEHVIGGFRAKATPSYLFRVGQQVATTHEGILNAKQLAKMFDDMRME